MFCIVKVAWACSGPLLPFQRPASSRLFVEVDSRRSRAGSGLQRLATCSSVHESSRWLLRPGQIRPLFFSSITGADI
jgi:hypothetical protein